MDLLRNLLERNSNKVCVALVLLSTLVALGLSLASGNELRYPDEQDYHALAESLIAGKGYSTPEGIPTAYRPPGWPVVLSGIYRLSATPLIAKIFNALVYGLSAYLLSVLVGRIVREGRIVAPLLCAIYPLALYTSTTLYPQTLATGLLLAVLVLVGHTKADTRSLIMAGLLFGFSVLTVPAFLLVSPLMIPFFVRPTIQRLCLFACIAALVVLPWTLRNTATLGGFTPVSTNSGINLLLGNSENTRPNSGVNIDYSHYLDATKGMTEKEQDTAFRNFAITWITHHPGEAMTLYVQKVMNYFNYRNQLHVSAEGSSTRALIVALSYYPLLLLALIRLFQRKRFPLTRVELGLYVLYFGNA